MTRRNRLVLTATATSTALLVGAYISQIFGWEPCAMCLWQRWPHFAAIVAGLCALAIPGPIFPLLGAAASATTGGIAIYHSGVERKWWEGPASCTGSGDSLAGMSGDALLPGGADLAPLVMCDALQPFFLGLTMANWNALFSVFQICVWLSAARAGRK
ncbi:disulfide bond formation protein B [Ruegeria sp. 2012CJ41-6]|uniref:Disulfide bond formation protein B n=1 Tax=Ruegeria spongiae TaxID=2942209 RepID=A0ABT0Q8P2_9RHOB|nr:disulfide bond formation protein B [Ruegeria spongiae]MCL6285538.1 disulfide bond formation protein B [Ruegeria spongiae]